VGEILAALRASGADDNTIVVFTTDHGDMMCDFGLLGKSQMYEASSRVPLLVRLPRQREQRNIGCPVSQIDLVPTLLDLMGRPVPKDLPGASLRALLEGSSQSTGRDVFIQWNQAPEKRTPIVKSLPDWANSMDAVRPCVRKNNVFEGPSSLNSMRSMHITRWSRSVYPGRKVCRLSFFRFEIAADSDGKAMAWM
jgi:hypothetical protein